MVYGALETRFIKLDFEYIYVYNLFYFIYINYKTKKISK